MALSLSVSKSTAAFLYDAEKTITEIFTFLLSEQ